MYMYVGGDPVNYVDPVGSSPWSATRSFARGVLVGFGGAVITGAVVTGLAFVSPALGVVGVLAIAGYGSFQLTIAAQRIVVGIDPWTRCPIPGEQRLDEAAGVVGAIIGAGALSGPRGPLFGRARFRNSGTYGIFNRGNTRVGWTRYGTPVAGRSYWGPHGGNPRIPRSQWHRDMISGPADNGNYTLWW